MDIVAKLPTILINSRRQVIKQASSEDAENARIGIMETLPRPLGNAITQYCCRNAESPAQGQRIKFLTIL